MAKALNRVTLLGNLGQDPEFKVTPQGSSVCTLNLATTESYKDKNSGEWKDTTEWHRITLWDSLADTANKYLKKGNKVYIEGKLKTRSYDDKDGVKRYVTEVQGQSLIMMGGGSGEGGGNYGGNNYASNSGGYNRNESSNSSNNSNNSGANTATTSYDNNDFDDEVPF